MIHTMVLSWSTIWYGYKSTIRHGNDTQEEFEDTKGVIGIRKSKDRQHNDQKKKDKRTNNDLQNIHMKLKIE
jgi:hypothetical protein